MTAKEMQKKSVQSRWAGKSVVDRQKIMRAVRAGKKEKSIRVRLNSL